MLGDKYPYINTLKDFIANDFPYLVGVFSKQFDRFGVKWADAFEEELKCFFKDNPGAMKASARGYGAFCLDSMKLQVKFNKTLEYDNKSYEEAASEVYQNRDYMFGLYLPGILISHYLWEHHYKQHLFFEDKLVPLLRQEGVNTVYDVGVGTGFYSREFLRVLPTATAEGFDMSPFSLEHTTMLLEKWGFSERYKTNLGDILLREENEQCDLVCSIEVLEHLEDPQSFLHGLCKMVKPGGLGFISAAINAPNADHIYLYRSYLEVQRQIEEARFDIIDYCNDQAYEPRRDGDLVPVNAAFIVRKKI